MRVLIAEDDLVSRRLLQKSIEQFEHQCVATTDGEEAWATLQQEAFDIVISDWVMPGMDGLELCRRVRAHDEDHYTYFILLTSRNAKDDFFAGMEAGADDYLTKPLEREELRARLLAASRLMSLHRQLSAQKLELQRLNRELYESGRKDALTGVGNRLLMQEDLETLHARAKRYGHRYCVSLMDIDYFKKYNDTCGHAAGDDALRTVASTLATSCRSGDKVYRYGGEEFLIIYPEQDLETAYIAVDRVRRSVEALALPHPGKDPAGVVTISAGIATLDPVDQKTMEQVLKEADEALYAAKEDGRNRAFLAEPLSGRVICPEEQAIA